jgi:TolB protein
VRIRNLLIPSPASGAYLQRARQLGAIRDLMIFALRFGSVFFFYKTMAIRYSFFVLLLGILSSVMPLSGRVIDIGVAEREGGDTVSIRVLSPDNDTQQIARRAFSLHGGFRVVNEGEAAVTAIFTPRGDAVELELRVRGNSASRTLRAGSLRESILVAADRVVETVFRTPGFFNSRIAFVGKPRGHSEVFISDLLFQQVRALTNDRSLVVSPRWSPDGRRLVYTSYHASGFPDIFTIDLVTGQRQALATFRGTNAGASFSPDGREIAMGLSGTGNSELFIANSNGTQLRRLTNNRSLESSPSWSPDGTRLVFTSDAPGRPQLHEMSSRGGEMRRIPTDISGYCAEPHWNPRDENLIAFTAAVAGNFQIALFDRSKRQSRFISNVPGSAVEPHWLNDGRHLLFTERRGNTKRLMILDSISGRSSPLHSPALGDASHGAAHYPRP